VYCHSKAGKYLSEHGIPDVVAPVTIGEHAFVGLHAIIMPGVTIGKGSVIVSGSVVFTNIPDHCIASGNPARVIKRLKPE